MNRIMFWECILLANFFLMQCCVTSVWAKDADNDVVWSWTRAYHKRTESLKIKPHEAAKIARKAWEETKHPISREPGFLVGRWYWLGMETKTDPPLTGYYVNGDTGKVEYRESQHRIKSGSRKLPKDPWTKITLLPETKPAQ